MSLSKQGTFFLFPERLSTSAFLGRTASYSGFRGLVGEAQAGTVPFGWRLRSDGALIEVPEHQGAIRHMVEMRRAGLSLRAIADAIKTEGFALSHVGVKKVLEAAQGRQQAA